MNKYTVVYTAYGRYDTQMDEPPAEEPEEPIEEPAA